MLPDRVSNPGPLTYESGALPIALRGPAVSRIQSKGTCCLKVCFIRKDQRVIFCAETKKVTSLLKMYQTLMLL